MPGRLSLPSPALVVAILALVASTGGIAFAAGSSGKPVTKFTVRTTNAKIVYSDCQSALIVPGALLCSGGGSVVARCRPGERATGFGYGGTGVPSAGVSVGENSPFPATGTPTGWSVSYSGSTGGAEGDPVPTRTFPVRVVCAGS